MKYNRKSIKCFPYQKGSKDERLQELEDKIEDGTLVELPCKVGGLVYRIIGMPWHIEEQRVDCITISSGGEYEILNDGGDELEIDSLYQTKAAAEARLKELRGEV